jgi:acyl-CoA reductase-like NAD-dependent aldehyde dehydrogenase
MSTTAPATTRTVFNYIGGEELGARGGETFAKHNPATGEVHSRVARSRARTSSRR